MPWICLSISATEGRSRADGYASPPPAIVYDLTSWRAYIRSIIACGHEVGGRGRSRAATITCEDHRAAAMYQHSFSGGASRDAQAWSSWFAQYSVRPTTSGDQARSRFRG